MRAFQSSAPAGHSRSIGIQATAWTPGLSARNSTWRLAAGASATYRLALYTEAIGIVFAFLLVAPYPLWSTSPHPLTDIAALSPSDSSWLKPAVALIFAAALVLPYRPYVLAQRLVALRQVGTRPLLVCTAVLVIIAGAMYPAYGSDVFDYALYERLWTAYGHNPLLATASMEAGDFLYPFAISPNSSQAYGPLWAILTVPFSLLGGASILGQVLAFKALALASYLVSCALIWRLASPPARTGALVFFAWSPLVLFDVVGKGHNDIVGTACILAALNVGQSSGRSMKSLLLAAAGALVKSVGGGLVPIMLASWWRDGYRGRVLAGVASLLVLVTAAYAPFWEGLRTFQPMLGQTTWLIWSPSTLIALGLASRGVELTSATLVAKVVLVLIWGIVTAGTLLVAPLRSVKDRACAAALILGATMFLLTGAVFAHYLVPIVALAAIADRPGLRRFVTAASMGGLAAYSTGQLAASPVDGLLGPNTVFVVGSLLTVIPPAVVAVPLVHAALRRRLLRRRATLATA